MRGTFVNFAGIEHTFHLDGVVGAIPATEKAGGISLVAGRSSELFDLK
jgi:hypothetical protein